MGLIVIISEHRDVDKQLGCRDIIGRICNKAQKVAHTVVDLI